MIQIVLFYILEFHLVIQKRVEYLGTSREVDYFWPINWNWIFFDSTGVINPEFWIQKMDAKALAKSKRAHSLHLNKKHNLHHTSKGSSAVSGTSAGDKKVSVKQVKEKPKPKLPSNWDRYEEENSDSETATQEGSSNTNDVVEPKSKGADYAYLLSEAKAQFQYSSENVSFCDDILDGIAFIAELLVI